MESGMTATYFCCEKDRRRAVRETRGEDGLPLLNGIDFLEVDAVDQRVLYVHFIHNLPGQNNPVPDGNELGKEHIFIRGGVRITDIRVDNAGAMDNILTVTVDQPGDFSRYRLIIAAAAENLDQPPEGFDPRLATVTFSFKVGCPGEFDCRQQRICPPEKRAEPDINYLAKDYASFRQLMLDRISVLSPDWQERHAADSGIALVELLALVGDHLSCHQDAVATEAYLDTARRRVSVKRHARLVDYFMHEGCNARVWVQVQVTGDEVVVAEHTQFLTRCPGCGVGIDPASADYQLALATKPEVFEAMHPALLFEAHNTMAFYTWSDDHCCLPAGTTEATLAGHFPALKKNAILILIETLDPFTGRAGDANPDRRHAVRLTQVTAFAADGTPLVDPLTGEQITGITWHQEDALPFPLCVSAEIEQRDGTRQGKPVACALGNIILADHGRTLHDEEIGEVPQQLVASFTDSESDDWCRHREKRTLPLRFRPRLQHQPLTHWTIRSTGADTDNGGSGSKTEGFAPRGPATDVFSGSVHRTLPAVLLKSGSRDDDLWFPQRDLLASGPFDRDFVVETENDGTVFLRFGDDRHGMRPDGGLKFRADYRVGNGVRGNIGANTLAHMVYTGSAVTKVWNPLPGRGGSEPESIEQVRRAAPVAFMEQERAVTAEDYAAMAESHAGVQKAVATLRWTGSWYTVFLVIDRIGGLPVDREFRDRVRRYIEKYRMAGHDIEVEGPQFVPLEIDMRVCVQLEYFRSDVKQNLLQVFSSIDLTDGRRGLFHPDRFTFGQPVYLSVIVAAAQAVAGVAGVELTTFRRQGRPETDARASGILKMQRTEIARLDNDPDFPDRGVFNMQLEGGK